MTIFILFLIFIGIAGGLAWFLVFHDHGEKEPIGALWMALGLGLLGAIPTLFLERAFVHIHPGITPDLVTLGKTSILIGVIEESCKFLPLAFLIYKRRFFNEHTDGVVYFALAGLGFGLPENIFYTAQFGTGAGVARIFLTPFFHAATTAIIGYFLVKQKIAGKNALMVAFPLIFMMVVHGLYDFGLMSGRSALSLMSVGITFTLSGTLFILFMKANERDQDLGLSIVGTNLFCRTCGKANPKRHLYCTHCGKNA